MCAAATALVFRNHRMRQWQLFVGNNIVCKGEERCGVLFLRTNPQSSTYFDQPSFGKLANLNHIEIKSHLLADKVILRAVRENNNKKYLRLQ